MISSTVCFYYNRSQLSYLERSILRRMSVTDPFAQLVEKRNIKTFVPKTPVPPPVPPRPPQAVVEEAKIKTMPVISSSAAGLSTDDLSTDSLSTDKPEQGEEPMDPELAAALFTIGGSLGANLGFLGAAMKVAADTAHETAEQRQKRLEDLDKKQAEERAADLKRSNEKYAAQLAAAKKEMQDRVNRVKYQFGVELDRPGAKLPLTVRVEVPISDYRSNFERPLLEYLADRDPKCKCVLMRHLGWAGDAYPVSIFHIDRIDTPDPLNCMYSSLYRV